MHTLGIDLASQTTKTAMCEIEWRPDSAYVLNVACNVADDDILTRATAIREAARATGDRWAIGIDAPFGWPAPFIDFINRAPGNGAPLPAWDSARRKELTYRLTDLEVIDRIGLYPLAVAADRIALPAMRCAGLLDGLGVRDRSGTDCVFEVYPAAALKAWGLLHQGYKGDRINSGGIKLKLADAFRKVRDACDPWLTFAPGTDTLCATSDDAFDALVAALVTRAAALGRTIPPASQGNNAERARIEGWIAVPRPGCQLGDLVR